MEKEAHMKQSDSDGEEEIFEATAEQLTTPAIIHPPPTTSGADSLNAIESLAVHEEVNSKSRSRSKSPVQRNYTQSPEVEYKILSQHARSKFIDDMYTEIHGLLSRSLTAAQLSASMNSLTNIWAGFTKEHDEIPKGCDYNLLRHPYVKNKVFETTYSKFTSTMARLHELYFNKTQESPDRQSAPPQPAAHRVSTASLPKLSLPTFDGNYSKWKPFKDMFVALIIQNNTLTDVERLHYLKTSLKGDAEQFTAHVSIDSDSFSATWANLLKRFENKQFLIAAHIDTLLNVPICTRTSSSLNKLIISVKQALDALKKMGSPVESWDDFVVHSLTMKLDDKTRETWQLHLGSQTEYPTLNQFLDFINDTARALEQIESTTSQPTQRKTIPTSAKAHVATTSAQPTQVTVHYPCDNCQGQHYIVSCSKFRELAPRQRLAFVRQQRLCFNCLGHHSVAACRSTKRCTHCSSNHHSMLHVNDGSANLQSTTPTPTPTDSSPSTSSSHTPAA